MTGNRLLKIKSNKHAAQGSGRCWPCSLLFALPLQALQPRHSAAHERRRDTSIIHLDLPALWQSDHSHDENSCILELHLIQPHPAPLLLRTTPGSERSARL